MGPFDLWENLQVLQEHLTSGWGYDWEPCWLIAITFLPHTFSAQEQSFWHRQLGSAVPVILDESWQFLGFDVADAHLLSGLMGCGHPDIDRAYLRYLNDFHLFTDLGQALKYKQAANAGNPQHAPFFVYGLHLIKDAATGKSWKGRKFMRTLDRIPRSSQQTLG